MRKFHWVPLKISELIGPQAGWAAVAALILSFVLPASGLGFSTCPTYIVTHRPCPLCGLTRSITCLSHLDFADSLSYHPFGIAIYVLMLMAASLAFIGESRREALRSFFRSHDRFDLWFSALIWYSILGFGLWRFIFGGLPA